MCLINAVGVCTLHVLFLAGMTTLMIRMSDGLASPRRPVLVGRDNISCSCRSYTTCVVDSHSPTLLRFRLDMQQELIPRSKTKRKRKSKKKEQETKVVESVFTVLLKLIAFVLSC